MARRLFETLSLRDNIMKTSTDMKETRAFAVTCAILLGSVFSMPVTAQETPAAAYTMAVVKNEAYGQRVTAGKYEQAIDKITRGGARVKDRFADQVNLCVAYAKTKDIENANASCNAALAGLKRQEARATRSKRTLVYSNYQRDLAVALSNRGVLFAVSGDRARAKESFAAAIELQTSVSHIAKSNLEHLKQSALPDA